MKKINPKSLATITATVAIQIAFVLFEYLTYWIANSNFVPSANGVLILNVSRILALIGGTGWVIWLLKYKYSTDYTWRDVLPLIFAILLLEYWYFVGKLLSLIT